MNLLHFGTIAENYKETLEGSLFEELLVGQVESLEQFFRLLDFRETSFLYNLVDLASMGEGSSIWHLNFNPENLFKDRLQSFWEVKIT